MHSDLRENTTTEEAAAAIIVNDLRFSEATHVHSTVLYGIDVSSTVRPGKRSMGEYWAGFDAFKKAI